MLPEELAPEKRAAMDQEIIDEDLRFQKKVNDLKLASDLSDAEKLVRETGYKNANATRKSQIRRSYGVSLRRRDQQKNRLSDFESTPASGRLDEFRAPSSSVSKPNPKAPQANGFSPVNTSGTSMPVTGYPYNASHPNGSSSLNLGIGALGTMNYQQLTQSNKRRRTSEDDTSSPGTGYNSPFATIPPPQSGLAMIQVEDAAASYAKRVSMQKKSTPARQSVGAAPARTTPSSNIAVVLPSFAGNGTKGSVYKIVDSTSEDDDDDDDGDDEDIPATVAHKVNGAAAADDVMNDGDENEGDEIMDSLMPSIEALR